MRNMKLSWEVTSRLQLLQANEEEKETIGFGAFDIEKERMFFVSSDSLIYTLHLPSSSSSNHDDAAWRKSSLPLAVEPVDIEAGDYITSFDYIMEKEALIIGTSTGLMLLHHVEDNSKEIVGKVEGGVKCISPSPDGDLLGVSTGLGQLLVMTHDWDLLYEITVDDDCPEDDEDVCDSSLSSMNSFKSSISWRGDGKYFATLSSVPNSSTCTKIKVWERDTGALHSFSEPKPLANSILEWMPSGAKIAAASSTDLKADKTCPVIVFYERNGLERSSFSICDEIDSTLEFLKWNCNSDLLATVVRCQQYDSVKIWFFSNNHWYLKQEVRYPKEDGVRFMWNPTKPLQLICWTFDGQVTVFNFIWVTSVNTENSVSFVIDGSDLLITPLSLSLMPPPMFLFKLRFPSAVRDIAFCSKSSRNLLAVSLSNGCLCVSELPQLDIWDEFEGKEFYVEASSYVGSFTHVEWLDSHVLIGASHFGFRHSCELPLIHSDEDGALPGYYLQELEITCFENEDQDPLLLKCSGWKSEITNQIPLEETLVGIVENPCGTCSAFVQFDGGKLFEYTSKFFSSAGARALSRLQILEKLAFMSSCPWMSVVPIADPLKLLYAGLDDNGRLHVNGKIICNNCSSFSFYSNSADHLISHLILATKQDLLFAIEIGDILQDKLEDRYQNFIPVIKKRNEEDKKNSINIWEKGAKIVGVLHGDEASVIVQTTRGNLECIYPRKLVLSSIINALIERRFMAALSMVRRHRIDFNVIIDHCGWQKFLDLASEFVRQVNNLSYITEFICSIKTENIMETLYKNYISLPSLQEDKVAENNTCVSSDCNNKITAVLMAIRKALEEQVVDSPARELCILTALARSDPPALEEALKRIKAIRDMELSGSDDPRITSHPSAEEALKHLLWLSDSEAVYESALGLYDLNLAAIVALNSQRDPKEFIPFLEDLKRMPTFLMKYNIDLKLKRYEDALRHIIKADEIYFVDCMNLMNNHPHLFPLGLQLITDATKRIQVLEAWGDHLSDIKAHEDAAATYLCCKCLEKALKAYRASGNWRGVMTVAGLISSFGKDEVLQLAHEVCEELQTLGKPAESARIALEYCGDVNRGVNLLVSAREWEEALRVAYMHGRDDLVLEVRESSLECSNGLNEEYKEGLEKVGKYLARYLAVRQRRLLLSAKLQSDGRSVNEFDDDTASETSSNFSGMSAYTTGTRKGSSLSVASSTTSKPRERRRQRNKGKIRAGSPDEEMALVEHMKGMSLTVGARRELKSLLVALVMLGKEDIARQLQRTGENFQITQFAAVKLAEEAMSSDVINEQMHSLEKYIQKVKQDLEQYSDDFSWQIKVLISP